MSGARKGRLGWYAGRFAPLDLEKASTNKGKKRKPTLAPALGSVAHKAQAAAARAWRMRLRQSSGDFLRDCCQMRNARHRPAFRAKEAVFFSSRDCRISRCDPISRSPLDRLHWGRSISVRRCRTSRRRSSRQCWLQWGRSLSAAEMRNHGSEDFAKFRASMGPQHFSCRDATHCEARASADVASMGPQRFSCGDAGLPQDTIFAIRASMGPQLFCCGDRSRY